MVQNLLLTSSGMLKFVLLHRNHPLTLILDKLNLVNPEELDRFIQKIKSTPIGQTAIFTLKDEILIYTMMDVTCKAYLTDLGDRMESMNQEALKHTTSSFSEIRGTILKGCEIVMDGMREELAMYPEFEERVDILNTYLLVE
jgi:hypothetical protein